MREWSLCRNTRAISSSFQTHSMFTTASVISGAPDSGSTTRENTWNDPAPSISAASISAGGRVRKYAVSMYTENGIIRPT